MFWLAGRTYIKVNPAEPSRVLRLQPLPRPPDMRVHRVTPVEGEAPSIAAQLGEEPEERTPEPGREEVEERGGGVTEPVPGGRAPGPSAADLLRPRVGDPRLWTVPGAGPPLTAHDRLRARVQARIDAINDSIRLAAEAERRAKDWTVEGKDGERWGVSPGKIHLGNITLPLPLSTGLSPDDNRRAAEWEVIQGQQGRAAALDNFEDRVKAIRERKDRERAERKQQQQQQQQPQKQPEKSTS